MILFADLYFNKINILVNIIAKINHTKRSIFLKLSSNWSPIGILWWWLRRIRWWHIRSWSSIRLELNSNLPSLFLSFHQVQFFFECFLAYLLLGLLKTSIIIYNNICCWLHDWFLWYCDNQVSRKFRSTRNIFTFFGCEGILNHLRLNSCVILFDKKYSLLTPICELSTKPGISF